MDMPITQINSEDLINIEQHFRVSAGPGAGKTYWLINHIKNVLHNSKRLHKSRKIACITYTNVAVDTILSRIAFASDRIEVSTIHSFLYKHVVKPYAQFLELEFGLIAKEMDGHDDTILSNYSFLQEWKVNTSQQRINEDNKIVDAIKNAHWKFDAAGDLIVRTERPYQANGYAIKNDSYLVYKKMAWAKGVVHHDDVLFFSYSLLKKYPFILNVLRAKFPYYFIDEFQDTNPIQTKIIQLIAQSETIVGVIGDQAQSIYGFQGAVFSQFQSFSITGLVDYSMSKNRRSTKKIVTLINGIRSDITQEPLRDDEGEVPTLLVGEMNSAFIKSKEISGNLAVFTLSRLNLTSNLMKRDVNDNGYDSKLLDKLLEVDKPSNTNHYRSKIVAACIKAVELARQKRFKDAIKELSKTFASNHQKEKGRKEALKVLKILLAKYDSFKGQSLYKFYEVIKGEVRNEISALRNGASKTFYEGHTYQQLAVCVSILEDESLHRTIHKAKGTEFDNVLLILGKESDLAFIQNSDIGNEEHRINYVAVSRAKNRLFINVPELSAINETALTSKLSICRLPKN